MNHLWWGILKLAYIISESMYCVAMQIYIIEYIQTGYVKYLASSVGFSVTNYY